jgi:hypothetical protein
MGAAGLDELHQHLVLRREGSLVGVGLDGVGVLIAQVLLYWRAVTSWTSEAALR